MCKGLLEVGLYMMVILQSDTVMPLQKKKKGNIMTVYKRVPVKPHPVENMMEKRRFCLFDVLTWWMLHWRCAHHTTHIWNFTLSPHVHMDKPFGTILEIMSIHTTHTHIHNMYHGHSHTLGMLVLLSRGSTWSTLIGCLVAENMMNVTGKHGGFHCFSFSGFFFCLF